MHQVLPELLIEIFILSTLPNESGEPHQLASLCLVSKEWNDIAKPLLYHSPKIKITSPPSNQWDSFYHTISETSAGSLIKNLAISRTELYAPIKASDSDKILGLLSKCPNLEDLRVRNISPYPAAIICVAPNLRHLKIDVRYDGNPSTSLAAGRKPEKSMLETLTLTDDTVGLLVDGPSLPPLPNFRHFQCRSTEISLPDAPPSTGKGVPNSASSSTHPHSWLELICSPSNWVQMSPRMLVMSRMTCGTHRERNGPKEMDPSDYLYDSAKQFFQHMPDIKVNHLHFGEIYFARPIMLLLHWELQALKEVEVLTITWDKMLEDELDTEERKAKILEVLEEECKRRGIRFGGVTTLRGRADLEHDLTG